MEDKFPPSPPDFDWNLTHFSGARREQLRRWAALPLESILRALEEMEEIAKWSKAPTLQKSASINRTIPL